MSTREEAKVRWGRWLQGLALMTVLCGSSALPVLGDWIITHDGERLETRGPWKQKGKLLVFTSPGGQLSSLRLSEVDLEASHAASRELRQASRASTQGRENETTPAAPVLVLTDGDVGRFLGPAAPAGDTSTPTLPIEPQPTAGSPDATEATPDAPAVATPRVVVTESRELDNDGTSGTVFTGRVRNTSSEVTGNLQLTVLLFDDEGKLLISTDAQLNARTLKPGQRTEFRAEFPDPIPYSRVEYSIESLALKIQPSGLNNPTTDPAEEPEGP